MRQKSQQLALGAMVTALGVVLMLLGAVLGLGMYLCPMLAGLMLLPLGERWGTKYQLTLYAAIGLLALMLVRNAEQNLMFLGLFGWYPALRPRLQKLSPAVRIGAKFLLFNAIVIGLEALLMLVLVPEVLGGAFLLGLLALGNVTFFLYDYAIPRFAYLGRRYLSRILRK